ncbi:transposase IS66 family protein [Vibrio cholerae HE-40]|jgi:transposase|nr:transposase IS66 family protein [Vibrio cholerae HE-40]EKL37286.1 transposase IS66 family protein [Vibrio cholerae HE-46]
MLFYAIMQAMKTMASHLPNDPKQLQEIILQLQSTLAQQETVIASLRHQLSVLKRARFGRSSEHLDKQIHQLELQLEELEMQTSTLPKLVPPATEDKATPRRRASLPSQLPREELRVEAACQCPACQGELTHIGDDVSEMLDVVPASYRVIRIVRPKFSCQHCEILVQGQAPERVIKKGLASAALLTQVVVDKYLDHQPLYRQAERMEREGIDVERSTLADWVGQTGALLTPLADAIGRHVKAGLHVHADDTTAPTLSPGKGRTQTGRYWTYVRDGRPWGDAIPPAVWLQYSEDRKSIHPTAHLKGYKGSLQADAYAGYNELYQRQITQHGCWAHVRRKFYDITQTGPSPLADEAITTIQSLYGIEKQARGKQPDERQRLRSIHAKPILEHFHIWLQTALRTLSKGSPLSKAIHYTLKQWEALVAYVDNGYAELDNNSAERSLRPIALGRKNYLFAGSVAGGERAAVLYSILGTAKLNGINPNDYLTAVLKRIGNHPINRIDELLPWSIDLSTQPGDAI